MAGRQASSVITRYSGIQVQTSSLGVQIPMGWGNWRSACNLIDYLDFNSTPQKAGAAGKGGSTVTGYNYTATIVLGLCGGPIDAVTQVWVNGKNYAHGSNGSGVADTGTTSACAQVVSSLGLGAIGQAPWSYLLSAHPTHAIGYSGLAIAYAENYPLDSGASTPNHSFEVVNQASFAVGGGYTGPDIDPSLMVTDFFTNARTGVPSWPSGALDTVTLTSAANSFRKYCLASGLLLSPPLDQQRSASDFMTEVLFATNSTVVWSEGLLKFVPYGDQALTANGVTYTPNLTPVYSLGDDDYRVKDKSKAPPLSCDIQDQSDAYNEVQLEYLDRTNQYNMAIALASDAANVAQYKLRRKDPDTCHVIATPTVAALAAQLWLQRNLYIRAQYKFSLDWAYYLLEPGIDLLELNDSTMGLSNYGVRIIQIDEDDKTGLLDFICEDLLVGVSHSPLYTMQGSAGNQQNQNVAAPAIEGTVGPVIFNPPIALTPGGVEMWAAVAGSGANWGGANVWVSFDGTNYAQVGQIVGPARYGVLTATFASGSDPDTTHTCSVDLTASGGVLTSAAQAVADAAGTLSLVDTEAIAYETATLTSAFHYNLTSYIRRGVEGTAIAAHTAGAPFVRLDSQIFVFPYLGVQVGQLVYVKFESFNPWGGGVQDLSTCTAYTTVPVPLGSRPPASAAWTAAATTISSGGASVPAVVMTGRTDNPSASGIEFLYRVTGTSRWTVAGTTSNGATQFVLQSGIASSQTYDVGVAYIVNGVVGQIQIISGSGIVTGGSSGGNSPGNALLNTSTPGTSLTFTAPAGSYAHVDIVITGPAGSGLGQYTGGGKGGSYTDTGGGGGGAVVVKGFPVTPGSTVFTYTLPSAVGSDATCTATGLSLTAHSGTNATGSTEGTGAAASTGNTATGASSLTAYAGRNGGLTDTWDGGGPGAVIDIPSGTVTAPGSDNTTQGASGYLAGQGGAGSIYYGVQMGGGANLLIIART